MSDSTRATRELLDALEGRWPTAVGRPDDRLVQLLAAQPDPIVRRAREALADPAGEPFARTLVYALQLAGSVGLKAAGWLGEDRLHAIDGRGRAVALGLLGVENAASPHGDPAASARLTKALAAAFGDRRYLVWLRRPLPAALDAAAIGRAVTLWLSAVDRGEWHGHHAVYEDEGVELELVLTEMRAPHGEGSEVFRIGPVDALERLSFVDQALVERAAEHDEDHPEVPLVFVVGSTAPWRLPRGFCEQLLYGTPDWVRTHSDPPTYEAGFHASGRSLFSDPLAAHVAAIWWAEPLGDDPMAARCRVHENPWSRCGWAPEAPQGPRFARVGDDVGARDRTVARMAWLGAWGSRG